MVLKEFIEIPIYDLVYGLLKVELTPPSPGELGQVVKSSAKLVQVHI